MSLSQCISDVGCYGFSVYLVEQQYRAWIVVPFYVVVSGFNEYTKECEYAYFRSAKRGDRKYSGKILSRFERLR